ncbi:MAG: leucine-rich repeat domain-containing protein [Ruminococcus sp.]|nr:leucine-rich repeat domain-containing protein [Ruminococcus sp.]
MTIPDSVTNIGYGAFYGCSSLTSVIIPDSVKSIGTYAFNSCIALTSVTISDSVTSIGIHTFYWCNSLTGIEVSEKNPNYSSENGVLFNKDKTELIQYPIGNTETEYHIPDSVINIAENAFFHSKRLTSVTIPDSVTSIGRGAFGGCESLTSVTYKGITFSSAKTNGIYSSEIIYMAGNRDFSVKMNHEVKYAVIWSVFRNTQEDEPTNAYIKKTFVKMFQFLIDKDDTKTVKLVIGSGKFLTKRNIDKFIQYANNKKEIADMLTEHKQQLETQSKSKKK